MTLTFKTAKYAIDEHGGAFRIVRIVENFDDLTERPNGVVTRAEAEYISEYDPNFKPCVVVTTPREAIEAAWGLAYEIEGGIVPRENAYIHRSSLTLRNGLPYLHAINTYGFVRDRAINNIDGECRLLDAPEPESWELSRDCQS